MSMIHTLMRDPAFEKTLKQALACFDAGKWSLSGSVKISVVATLSISATGAQDGASVGGSAANEAGLEATSINELRAIEVGDFD